MGCASCSPFTAESSADQKDALSKMVISPGDFDRSFGLPCEKASDCTLPLVCESNRCAVPPSLTGRVNEKTPVLSFHSSKGAQRIYIEIADSEYTRQKGMMKRKAFDQNWGMLFIFQNHLRRSFWMSQTYIPLDMVFIRRDGSVSNTVENAAPLDEGPRYVSTDRVKYVLELPAGAVQRFGIDTSSRFDLSSFESK